MIDVTPVSTPPLTTDADVLIVGAWNDGDGYSFTPTAAAFDDVSGGVLATYLDAVRYAAKPGDVQCVPASAWTTAAVVAVVGLGSPDEFEIDTLRRAAGTAANAVPKARRIASALVEVLADDPAVATAAVVEGTILGAYRFNRYKAEPAGPRLVELRLPGADAGSAAYAKIVADATNRARDLANTPAEDLSPEVLARTAQEWGSATGLAVEIWDHDRIRAERLGGVLAVNQGSERPPVLIQLRYVPEGASRGHLLLVGKGITFDSGGLSLKTAEGMETMKTDMSGGAAVIAAMAAIGELAPDVTVTGIVPATENMPSGTAIRPGDVFRARNGVTVEVLNTDAEGRLILADALSLAVEAEPDAIVDLATLTGACMVALGPKVAGLLATDDDLALQIASAADRAGEKVWRLPLVDSYNEYLESEIADVKNIGIRYGGAITAGLFLKRFAGTLPWAHLDIAGPARYDANDPIVPKGASGFGVRTLLELVAAFTPPQADA